MIQLTSELFLNIVGGPEWKIIQICRKKNGAYIPVQSQLVPDYKGISISDIMERNK